MRTSTFLAELRNRDVRVSLAGETLRCNAPAGSVTDELRRSLAERKPEIVAFLRARAAPRSTLVTLQPAGSGRPFFGVPGHNGDVFSFVRLARQLGAERPFFALEPPGADGRGEPLSRIEDLARHHVETLLDEAPAQSYRLGGYCLGGLVAFEMAHQLRALGRGVAELVLFETTCPARRWRRTRGLVERLVARSARRGDRVAVASSAAAQRYVPSVYPGPVTFFSSHRGSPRRLGWDALAGDGLTVVFGPDGCHPNDMLLDPHAKFFADRLHERLAGAEVMW